MVPALEPPLPAPEGPPEGFEEESKPTNSSPCDQPEPESSSSGIPALPLGVKEQKTQWIPFGLDTDFF